MILVCAMVLAGCLAAALASQHIAAVLDQRRFPPLGRMIALNGHRLHLWEQGSGTPTVVLEAGLAASSLSWSYVQERISGFTHVVSYDRAGLGWSEASPARSLEGIADELCELLEGASILQPVVLVGHSFGALVVRAFAHRYPDRVAGMVLVDPVSIEAWANCGESGRKRIALGAKLSRRGARLAQLGVVRFAVAAASLPTKWITRNIARASAGQATPMLGRLVGEIQKLPTDLVPMVRAQWSVPKSFLAMADYLECLPEAAVAASTMKIPRHLPLLVLSAATATRGELAERDKWTAERDYAKHTQIADTGHWLHLERPDIVAEAVRDVIETWRSMRHGVNDVVDTDASA